MPTQAMTIPPFSIPDTLPDNILSHCDYDRLKKEIAALLRAKNGTLITHYYTSPDVQKLTDDLGGFIGDSLAMAKFGKASSADMLLVCGVRFMGESAKILSPEKQVIMPTLLAECSLDLSCPADLFQTFREKHPERTVVVYANTSAAVKAQADWVVTSSNALDIVSSLADKGEKILWAPDRFLGDYIQKQTQADMLLWQGSCIVHEEFKAKGLRALKAQYPEAAVLVHPESPADVIALANVVGSTTVLLNAVEDLTNPVFIVATDRGLFYKMKQLAPGKKLIEAPTAGRGATCKSCAHCPWMAMNDLGKIKTALIHAHPEQHEIVLDSATVQLAQKSLNRMLAF